MRGIKPNQRGRIILGDVIVEIDGQPIANEDDYATILEKKNPGDMVNVVTRRDNQLLSYEIKLQASPDR